MTIIGDIGTSDRAAHRVSGPAQIMAATVEPYRVEFGGWELAEHPWPSYQRADGYRVRATCLRCFLYKCAWRDAETWHLPEPTAIFSPLGGNSSETPMEWPRQRPYWSLSWLELIERSHGQRADAGDFAFGGDTIFRLATERYGAGLDGLIPPGAKHDLLVIGLAYRRVAKRWPPVGDPPEPQPKDSQPANRKLWCVVNIFSAADGREEVP